MNPERPESIRVLLLGVGILEELGVAYHIGGSYASSVHGIPRQTQDIDLVVDLPMSVASRLVSRLSDDFYIKDDSVRDAIRSKRSFNIIHHDSGLKIDFFIRGDAPFDSEEFARHRPELIQAEPECRVLVANAEDTLLRKLWWYRQGGEASDRQWSDVLGIVRTQGDRLDEAYLERWAGELGVGDLLGRALGRD